MEKKGTYITNYTGDDTIPAFVTFCIEQYKNYKNISGAEAVSQLTNAGVLEYLVDFYDTLHLEGTKWILEDIDRLVELNILKA